MTAEVFDFVLDVFFTDIDVFGGCDAVYDQFGLDIFLGAVFLTLAKADPVQIHRAGVDPLLGEGADDALETNVFLMFHERLRNREVVPLDEFEDNLFALQILAAVLALVLEALANLALQFVERCGITDVFGEVVV
jgi:hypothetical protein